MEFKCTEQKRFEVYTDDDIPIAYVVSDKKGIHWIELINDYLHTKEDVEILINFLTKVKEYKFAEEE